MYRATTPTHQFTFPAEIVPLIEKVKVSYAQKDTVLFELDETALSWVDNKATVSLTQEQANLFNYKREGQVQIRVLTTGGQVYASEIFAFEVQMVLDDEVMS